MKWVVATGNNGKLAEFRELLDGGAVELLAQGDLGIDGADETGHTFVENALQKARHAAAQSGLPALADDSGLLVDALDGAPGLISAHYAGRHGDNAANIARLLAELDNIPAAQRSARFYCVLVLLQSATDPQPLIAEGVWHGRILRAPRGAGGFGYDPVFFDPAQGASAAELPSATKNRVSHRGQALARLRQLCSL